MKAIYIGILTPGSTSRMRAECLSRLTPEWAWDWVDTDPPLQHSARLWQTLAFRSNIGAAVDRINDLVSSHVSANSYDLVWVDKAVFLRPPTMERVRQAARRLAHFTPDTAFHANRSRHFESSLQLFDLLVTTKSFEVPEYRRRTQRDTVLLTTQGYDATVHFPRSADAERKWGAVFAGLSEPDREECIALLLENGIPVQLAGRGWERFLRRWGDHDKLTFAGEDVFGAAYAELLSKSWIGLGLLSKRFPELHTTRTFEIPACGAVLATESTSETGQFFAKSEALFFSDYSELISRIRSLIDNGDSEAMAAMAGAGKRRVTTDGRDYGSILSAILSDPRLAV